MYEGLLLDKAQTGVNCISWTTNADRYVHSQIEILPQTVDFPYTAATMHVEHYSRSRYRDLLAQSCLGSPN